MTEAPKYVVTFDLRYPLIGTSKLKRMTLAEARRVIALADRIPKHGHIVNANTLELVS